MFEWKKLGDSIEGRLLEVGVLNEGMGVFFKDEVMGYLGLEVMIGGEVDV